MIENYINKHSIMGMLSKNYIPFENWEGFYKNKKRDKIVVFNNIEYKNEDAKEINYYYLFEKPEYKKYFSSTVLVSFFNEEYFELRGKKCKEMRETRNKWNKKIIIKNEINSINEISDLIKIWDINSGEKYRWNRHSGHDRNFFIKYYEQEKENLYSLFFYFGEKLIGYSVVSKISEDNCYRYIVRKMNISVGRNIGLYIDFKTIENIWREIGRGEFYVNWGASAGKLLKYKRKFSPFLEKKVWFCKVKNEEYKI